MKSKHIDEQVVVITKLWYESQRLWNKCYGSMGARNWNKAQLVAFSRHFKKV